METIHRYIVWADGSPSELKAYDLTAAIQEAELRFPLASDLKVCRYSYTLMSVTPHIIRDKNESEMPTMQEKT